MSSRVSGTEALVFEREHRRQQLMKQQVTRGPLSGTDEHILKGASPYAVWVWKHSPTGGDPIFPPRVILEKGG